MDRIKNKKHEIKGFLLSSLLIFLIVLSAPILNSQIFARSLNVPAKLNTLAIRKEHESMFADRKLMDSLYSKIQNTAAYKENEKYIFKRPKVEQFEGLKSENKPDLTNNRKKLVDPGYHYYPKVEEFVKKAKEKTILGEDDRIYYVGLYCTQKGIQAPDRWDYSIDALDIDYKRETELKLPEKMKKDLAAFLEPKGNANAGRVNLTADTELKTPKQKSPNIKGTFDVYKDEDDLDKRGGANYFKIFEGEPDLRGPEEDDGFGSLRKSNEKWGSFKHPWLQYLNNLKIGFVYEHKKHARMESWVQAAQNGKYKMKKYIPLTKYSNWSESIPPRIHHAISTGSYVEKQKDKDELTPDAGFILTELVKVRQDGSLDKYYEEHGQQYASEDQKALWLTKEGGGPGIKPRGQLNGQRVCKDCPMNPENKNLSQRELRNLRDQLEDKKFMNKGDLEELFRKSGFTDNDFRKGDGAWADINEKGDGSKGLVDSAAAFVEYWEKIKSFNSAGGEKHGGYAYHNDYTFPDGKIAKNPKINYKPGIINPNGSLEDASKPKFDELNQQWLLGPYTLDYIEDGIDCKKKFATIVDAELFGNYLNGESDSGEHLSSEYRNVKPNKDNLKEFRQLKPAKKKGSVRNWKFTIDCKSDCKEYPRPGETFYISVDYDPALIEITRIEFEFAYLVYGGENHDLDMRSFYIKNGKITAEAIPKMTEADKYRSPGKLYYGKSKEVVMGTQSGTTAPEEDRTNERDPQEFPQRGPKSSTITKGVTEHLNDLNYDRFGLPMPPLPTETIHWLKHEPDKLAAFKFLNESKLNKVKLKLEGDVTKADTQNHCVNRAARWYESVVLELKLNAKLILPVGGKVWEDLPNNTLKHVGFNHVFDKSREKGIKGIKATVYRIVAEFNKDKTKIEKIISKQEADVIDSKYNKQTDMFTDENGRWGTTYDSQKEAYVHTVGLSKNEKCKNCKNVGVAFSVEFEYDGIYYEPVLPLQTEQATEKEKNIMVQEDGSNPITHIDPKAQIYANSSTAVENLKERSWNNRQHAEISRYNSVDDKLNTLGIANSIDENGNRQKDVIDLNYKGEKISESKDKEGETITRIRSKYVKKTPEEYLNGRQRNSLNDSEYAAYKARFIAAETINLGIYNPNKWKYTYDYETQTITQNNKHNGTYYGMFGALVNFNLGLRERQALDVSILENLSGVLLSVNKKAYVYTYDDVYTDYLPKNDLDEINLVQSNKDNRKINLGLDLYKTDYIYRTSLYNSSADLYNALKEEMKNELKKDQMAFTEDRRTTDTRQLDVFFLYKTSVYNDSIMDKVLLSQLDQYYDSKLELVNKVVIKEIEIDPKKDIESKPGKRNGKRTDDGINLERKNLNVVQPKFAVFDNASKDNKLSAEGVEGLFYSGNELVDVVTKVEDKARSRKFEIEKVNKIYSSYEEAINSRAIGSLADGKNMDAAISYTSENITKENETKHFTLGPSQRADIYMAFRVKNADTLDKVEEKPELKGVSKLNNALQLGKFKIVTEIGAFASYDILTGEASGKVDQDSAPGNIKKEQNIYEDDTDKAYTLRLKIKNEAKNPERNRRTIDGTIWEDLRNKQNRGILTGDGKFDPKVEKGIPNMPITLEERLSVAVNKNINLTKLVKSKVQNAQYIDVPFMWPEKIESDDIALDLKTATGFESHVLSNANGYFKFIGVPAGNFVVKVNYSTPGIDTLKKMDVQRNNYPAADRLIEKNDISKHDLVETVAINNENRVVKYYNGADFKSTMFYVEGGNNDYSRVQGKENPSNIAKTWLDKNIKVKNNSYLKDDEYRRVEVSQNMITFKNQLVSALHEYTKDKSQIDENKLKYAHNMTMMVAQTPKINFSIEYYEKYKNECEEAKKKNVWDEFKEIYALKGIYEVGKEASQEINYEYNLHNLNLGLVQRPLTKFKMLKEISNIQLRTADGKKNIDVRYNLEPEVSVPDYEKINATGYNYGKYSTLTVKKNVIQDQSLGNDYVLSLDRTYDNSPKQGFRYISIDKSLMQDSTIQIEYKIFAFNLSEVDKKYDLNLPESAEIMREKSTFIGADSGLGELNYQYDPKYEPGKYIGLDYYVFTNRADELLEPDSVANLTIKNIMDISDNNTTVKLDDKINQEWTGANKKDLIGLVEGVDINTFDKAEYVDEKGIRYIDQKDVNNPNSLRTNIFLLKNNNVKLIPTTYRQFNKQNTEGTYQIWTIRLDRTISNQADKQDLKFENMAEIVEYASENYRHSNDGVVGNVFIGLDKLNGNGAGVIPGVGEAKNLALSKSGQSNKFVVATGEADSAIAELVTLSQPTGLSRKELTLRSTMDIGLILQIVFLSILVLYLLIIYIIKKVRKIKKQRENE